MQREKGGKGKGVTKAGQAACFEGTVYEAIILIFNAEKPTEILKETLEKGAHCAALLTRDGKGNGSRVSRDWSY